MLIIPTDRLPIYSWAPDLDATALQQAINCALLPVAHHHVAVMADGHQGYGVPIGAVLALSDAISPYAVGNDIGCGMGMLSTTLSRDQMLAPVKTRRGALGAAARDDIMGWVQSTVPAASNAPGKNLLPGDTEHLLQSAFDAMQQAAAHSGVPLSTSQSPGPGGGRALSRDDFLEKARLHAGTLGAGNHFIELLAGEGGEVALLVHSGSRGVGGLICSNFHRMAVAFTSSSGYHLPDEALSWLPLGEAGEADRWIGAGRCYEIALHAGLEYAATNRRLMMEKVGEIIERRFPGCLLWDRSINIHHNDATLEPHYGKEVWVHRKGAVKASLGAPTITPGSMGAGTVVGRGLGNPESFCSCSHGAGRVLSRGRAKAVLSLQDQLHLVKVAGGKVFAQSKQAVLDEMPGAYKDLDQVMANQADLVEPVRHYTPLATYKGVEASRHHRRPRHR